MDDELAAAAQPTDAPGPGASAVDRVVQGIKHGIRSGRYSPGQRLVEIDLSEELRVSRNTLRDGIQRLVAEGLVHVERYKGATVRKISKVELIELTTIRAALEGLAAAAAARQSKEAIRQTFEAIDERFDRSNLIEVVHYRAYNTEFHDAIIRLSGLSSLNAFIGLTKLALVRLHFEAIILQPDRMKASLKEHAAIEKAIRAGRPDDAELAMRAHIGRTNEIILSAPDQFFSESSAQMAAAGRQARDVVLSG